MTNFYIAAAWVTTFGIVGAYAVSVLVRGRRLTRLVPYERRRWMMDRSETDAYTIADMASHADKVTKATSTGTSGVGGGVDV